MPDDPAGYASRGALPPAQGNEGSWTVVKDAGREVPAGDGGAGRDEVTGGTLEDDGAGVVAGSNARNTGLGRSFTALGLQSCL